VEKVFTLEMVDLVDLVVEAVASNQEVEDLVIHLLPLFC
jgi:hypothetical protein